MKCDAGKYGFVASLCDRKATLRVVTRLGAVLCYCDRHRGRAENAEFVSLPLRSREEIR